MIRYLTLGAAALSAACAQTSPAPATRAIPELAGRMAGVPQRCVTIERHQALRVASPHALIYGAGRTVWLNPVPECSSLRYSDVLVLEPIGTRYCKGDIVQTLDAASKIPGPSCQLGDFVPYARN